MLLIRLKDRINLPRLHISDQTFRSKQRRHLKRQTRRDDEDGEDDSTENEPESVPLLACVRGQQMFGCLGAV